MEISPIKKTLKSEVEFKDFDGSISLDKKSTHVFKISISEFDREYHSLYQTILSGPEFTKAERFVNPADSRRYLVSRFVIRHILSSFLLVNPLEIQFHQTANKKPSVNGIEFNVSHSGNYLLIAVSPDNVGIDIEMIKPNFEFKSILNDLFNLDERAFMEDQQNQLLGFYWLWTRKEAILKATGEGLMNPMALINSISDQISRNGNNYKLKSFIEDNKYVWSIAMLKNINSLLFWNYSKAINLSTSKK